MLASAALVDVKGYKVDSRLKSPVVKHPFPNIKVQAKHRQTIAQRNSW